MKPEKQADLLIHAVISGQKHLHDLEQLKHTRFYHHEAKNKINLSTKILIQREALFEGLINSLEDTATEVHDVFFDFMQEVKPTTISEAGELKAIIQAYRKNPDSILGITKKILK